MSLKPLLSNVLVRLEEAKDDAVIVTEKPVNELKRAIVVEIGNGEPSLQHYATAGGGGTPARYPMEVRPQMYVYFDLRDAKPVSYNGETLYVLNQENIYLIEEEK